MKDIRFFCKWGTASTPFPKAARLSRLQFYVVHAVHGASLLLSYVWNLVKKYSGRVNDCNIAVRVKVYGFCAYVFAWKSDISSSQL